MSRPVRGVGLGQPAQTTIEPALFVFEQTLFRKVLAQNTEAGEDVADFARHAVERRRFAMIAAGESQHIVMQTHKRREQRPSEYHGHNDEHGKGGGRQ